jgi:hypothetical protein
MASQHAVNRSAQSSGLKTTVKTFGDMFFFVDLVDTLNVWRKMSQFLLKNVIVFLLVLANPLKFDYFITRQKRKLPAALLVYLGI